MEGAGGGQYDGVKNTVRKKRSLTCRRPRPDSQVGFLEGQERSSPLVSTPSDDFSKISSDDIPAFDTNPRRKEFSLSQCMSRAATVAESGRDNYVSRRGRGLNKNVRSTEGVLAPANWKNASQAKDGLESDFEGNEGFNSRNGEIADFGESEGKVKKVKLKVGGLPRTIHANGLSEGGSSRKSHRLLDDSGFCSMQSFQENSDDCNSPQDKKVGLQGIRWKDFSLEKESSEMGRKKQGEPTGPVRKSKRVPKRRVFDGDFSEEDDDDEIRYLEKLKLRASSAFKEDAEESGRRQQKPSEVSNGEGSEKGKSRSDKGSDDMDYEEEERESASDNENEAGNRNGQKKQQKESAESSMEMKREMTLTTRQRALASGSGGSNVIEFPDGLPPAPSRRNKEKLTD
ncbi:PREDICTED: uncharacterized protein LOC104800350, partial [Tarenaya hassleriana]|uniref:uncharacterized protein LOC104800350 n=1 Tax=Tarenaya hassleriana TaxID=28532 RepID=UPI00053C7FA9